MVRTFACLTFAALLIVTAQAQTDGVQLAQVTGHVSELGADSPIEGARVRITPVGSSSNPPGLKPQDVLTDSRGEFRVELPSAQYMLTVTKPGFMSIPRLYTFAPGERIEDLRFAMNRGGSVAGHVSDVKGQPLNNFVVMALAITMRDGRLATARGVLARSTNDGAFTFPTLPAGEYVVVARPATPAAAVARLDDGRLTYGPTFYPSALDLERAERVTLGAGDTLAGIHIIVQPAPTFALTGIVIDTTGASVTRARLSLGWDAANPGAGTRPLQTTYTDAAGAFRFDVPSDVYRLDVVLPSRTPPPGGTDVFTTDPDGNSVYVLADSPRTWVDVEVHSASKAITVILPINR